MMLMRRRNGRIPPLPKGYSPALSSVIKSMLNLNVSISIMLYRHIIELRLARTQPAMRPSAAQLLGHERLELAYKVTETQKLCVCFPILLPRAGSHFCAA